jgi:hypothetical protein
LRIVGAAHKAIGLAIYARKRPDQRSGRSTPSCILASLRQRLTGAPLRGVAARQREEVHIANAERVDHRGRRLGHVLTPRWGAGVRPIDCSRHVLPALPPELPTGRFAHAVGGPGRIPDKLDLDRLGLGRGHVPVSLLCRCARRTATLVMVIASRRAQHPGLTRFGA